MLIITGLNFILMNCVYMPKCCVQQHIYEHEFQRYVFLNFVHNFSPLFGMTEADGGADSGAFTSSNSRLIYERKPSVIHLLPCNIHHDGPAPVQNYFQTTQVSKTQSSDKEHLLANFRGRRIEGLPVQLPETTVGCVVHTCQGDNQIEVHSIFNSLTVWEHDQPPSEEVLGQSMEYFDMANIVRFICKSMRPAWSLASLATLCTYVSP